MTALQTKYDDRITSFVDAYESSDLKNDPNLTDPDVKPINDVDIYNKQKTSQFYQLQLIIMRSFLT